MGRGLCDFGNAVLLCSDAGVVFVKMLLRACGIVVTSLFLMLSFHFLIRIYTVIQDPFFQ